MSYEAADLDSMPAPPKQEKSEGFKEWFQIYSAPVGDSTVVTLDSKFITAIRHNYINTYPDFMTLGQQRCNCFSDNASDQNQRTNLDGRNCLICNLILTDKNYADMTKRFTKAYTTVLVPGPDKDPQQAMRENKKVYFDKKYLLELDDNGIQLMKGWRKTAIDARWNTDQTLIGIKWQVTRKDLKSSRYGQQWTPIEKVDVRALLWHSPAVPTLVENSVKYAGNSGRAMTHEEAVNKLSTPFDYDKAVPRYTKDLAEAFIQAWRKETHNGAKKNAKRDSNFAMGYQAPPLPGQGPALPVTGQYVAPPMPAQPQQMQGNHYARPAAPDPSLAMPAGQPASYAPTVQHYAQPVQPTQPAYQQPAQPGIAPPPNKIATWTPPPQPGALNKPVLGEDAPF